MTLSRLEDGTYTATRDNGETANGFPTAVEAALWLEADDEKT